MCGCSCTLTWLFALLVLRFQPWPESSLFSVAKKFLDEIDLGDDALRNAVVEFMPYSFALVNKVSKKFLEVERRYNYTTPKTFLELIKLYKNVLLRKRKATQVRTAAAIGGVVALELLLSSCT